MFTFKTATPFWSEKTFLEKSQSHTDRITKMLQTGSDILGMTIIDFSIQIPQSFQCVKNVHLAEIFVILHFPKNTDLPSVHKVVKKMQSRVLLAWNAQPPRQGHERYELWHTSRPARKKHKTGTGLPLCPSSEETFLQIYASSFMKVSTPRLNLLS